MPVPGKVWRHVNFGTHSSWLPGSEKGWRARWHKRHSSGDYKKPPPTDEHEGLREYCKENSSDVVEVPWSVRPRLLLALVRAFQVRGHRVLAGAQGERHTHLLVEQPDSLTLTKRVVGQCKGAASHRMRVRLPGTIFAEGASYKRVENPKYQHNAFDYIVFDQGPGAFVWSIKFGLERPKPWRKKRYAKGARGIPGPEGPASSALATQPRTRVRYTSISQARQPKPDLQVRVPARAQASEGNRKSSESDFIRWLHSHTRISDLTRVPIGDDLAVLNWNPRDLLLVGIDQVLDGVHFDSSKHGPREIAVKAMNRNLSDCAAMACLPAAAVVSAALPRGVGLDYAKELYLGLRDAGDPFDCQIVGGDTGSWDGKLALTVAILCRSDGVEPVTRSGARPGDLIYVTGSLGGSILGRHMRFVPRVREARRLAQTGAVTAMIDVSDGLSRDLRNLCESSGVGARVEADLVPIHPDATELSRLDQHPPLDHALHDGEDHELLFTASRALPDFPFPCSRIGQVIAGSEVLLVRNGNASPLEPRGWDHPI